MALTGMIFSILKPSIPSQRLCNLDQTGRPLYQSFFPPTNRPSILPPSLSRTTNVKLIAQCKMQAPHRHHGRPLRAQHDIRRPRRFQDPAPCPTPHSRPRERHFRLPYDDRRGGYVYSPFLLSALFTDSTWRSIPPKQQNKADTRRGHDSLRNGSNPSKPPAATSTPSTTKPPSHPPQPTTRPLHPQPLHPRKR